MLPTCVPRGAQWGGEGSVASCSLHCHACQTWVRAAWCKFCFTEETVLREVEASIVLFFPVKNLELRAPSLYLLPSKPPKVLTLKMISVFYSVWLRVCLHMSTVCDWFPPGQKRTSDPQDPGSLKTVNRQSGPRQKQVLLTASLSSSTLQCTHKRHRRNLAHTYQKWY